MNKIYIVTAVNTYDEFSDGKARVLGAFKNEDEAKAFVRNDIEEYVDSFGGFADFRCDFDKMNAWTKDKLVGCEWNIGSIEVQ